MSANKAALLGAALMLAFLPGCGASNSPGTSVQKAEYIRISAQEAHEMMSQSESFVLLDVRNPDEFKPMHIQGAVLIPGSEIAARAEKELPDKAAAIFVYCQSGRRSQAAANALLELGYSQVYDFGAIGDWPFGTVSDSSSGAQASGKLIIRFDFEKQTGSASNQYAIWIEGLDGTLVKTVCVTSYTVNGGYGKRPDSIPLYVQKADIGSMQPSEIDAISSPTPKTGTVEYIWDLTDSSASPVSESTYIARVQGTLRWDNQVLYSHAFTLGQGAFIETVEPQFSLSTGSRALAQGASELGMIKNVQIEYVK